MRSALLIVVLLTTFIGADLIDSTGTVPAEDDGTIIPTVHLTAHPTTHAHSIAISISTSMTDTAKITENPMFHPTTESSSVPTITRLIPTAAPSGIPTKIPSHDPTKRATSTPIENPTTDLPRSPTSDPTKSPTADPIQLPSIDPTQHPLSEFTMIPTVDPNSDASAYCEIFEEKAAATSNLTGSVADPCLGYSYDCCMGNRMNCYWKDTFACQYCEDSDQGFKPDSCPCCVSIDSSVSKDNIKVSGSQIALICLIALCVAVPVVCSLGTQWYRNCCMKSNTKSRLSREFLSQDLEDLELRYSIY